MKIRVIAYTTNGCRTALKFRESFPDEDVELTAKTSADTLGIPVLEGSSSKWFEKAFAEADAIISIGAVGITVRYMAPFIRSKTTDPAVVAMDEKATWQIPLLSGHIGGANRLASLIAERMGSEAVITTATDLNGKFSVDTFASMNGLRIMGMAIAQETSVRILKNEFVGFCSDVEIGGTRPPELTPAESGPFGICITSDASKKPFDTTMRLVTEDIVIGVGCKRDTDPGTLEKFVLELLEKDGIDKERVNAVCSIDLKKDEKAVLGLARSLKCDARFFTADELLAVEGDFSTSDFVRSVTSVDCVCERSAVQLHGGELIRRKTAENGMTAAFCRRKMEIGFL